MTRPPHATPALRLLLPLVLASGCHALPSARNADDFTVAATAPAEERRYRLHVWMQEVGFERDTFTPLPDGGLEAKASAMLADRQAQEAVAALYRLDRDGWPTRVDQWGDSGRDTQVDDHLRALGDGQLAVRQLGQPARTLKAAPPYAFASQTPLLGLDLMLRAWNRHGRPATLPLLPAGSVHIESLGREPYDVGGQPHDFEHVVIEGLVWGREDAWLDDQGKLAGLVTRDGEGGHFEAARAEDEGLLDGWMASAANTAMRWLAGALHAADEPGPVALVGGRLIDGSGAPPVEDAVVVYQGDRILAAGPRATTAIPPGARQVDVHGKSVLPGLWDLHAHMQQAEWAAVYLASGVTSVRDMGNVLSFITTMRDAIESGRGVGPRILVNALVDGENRVALGALRIDDASQIPALIDRLVRAHCVELKIYTTMRPELVPLLTAEAHRRGLRVTGHVPFGLTADTAIDAGFDGLAHAEETLDSMILPWKLSEIRQLSPADLRARFEAFDPKAPRFQRLFDKMAAKHTLWDPTLVINELQDLPLAEIRKHEPGLAKLPPSLQASVPGVDEDGRELGALAFRKYKEAVAEAHRHGVTIVPGSDGSVFGYSLHRDMELLVEIGMTPMEVLMAATSVPAHIFGRDDLGLLAAGKRADILVVDGNPLADMSDARKVSLVVARGRSYQPAALWKLVGFQP